MVRRSTLRPTDRVKERETSKSSSTKVTKGGFGWIEGQKPRDDVQELYRPKRSSLGYKLQDYNTFKHVKV